MTIREDRGRNQTRNSNEVIIKNEFMAGDINYYDAVIRLMIDDCNRAQVIIDQWEKEHDKQRQISGKTR